MSIAHKLRNLEKVVVVVVGFMVLPQLGWAQVKGRIESPEATLVQSGVALIRGWVCTASVVEVQIDDGSRVPVVYKLVRGDTQPACGDVDNGFAALVNWNTLAEGVHTLVAYADGVEFDRVAFTVTSLGLGEFPTGLSGQFPVDGFPLPGQSVAIEWREAAQNFVLSSVGGNNGTGGQQTALGQLESPATGKVQSGVDLIRGWVCTANLVELELDGGGRFPAVYKLLRGDTQTQCGDVDNGFAVLVNWNDVGAGLHTVRVYADGVLVAMAEFRVVTLGLGSFPRGLDKAKTLVNFPQAGQRVQVRWQESRQNFSLQGVLAPQQSANICGSQSGQLQDSSGTIGSITVDNPCTAKGDTVGWGLSGPVQFAASAAQREARAVSTSLQVCVADFVIEQGGQQFTSEAFRWVDRQGNEITCLKVEAGQTLTILVIVKPGAALNFNLPFQLRYRQTLLVTFSEILPPQLTILKGGNGSGTILSDPVGISCGLNCTENYQVGTVVTLMATPASGSTFSGWSGDCSGKAPTTQVTMTTDRTCIATFTSPVVLTVTKAGNGNGTVTSSPLGIACGLDCSESYASGTVVTLTATADMGASFSSWSGACSGTASTTQVTMDAAKTCTATFIPASPSTFTLMVTTAGTGSGTVSGSGISCGADCSESYPSGSVVTLTATPAAGSTFSSWSGDCSGKTPTIQVTMTADRTCTATFNLVTYTLTVTTAGTGSGSVISSPAGITCTLTRGIPGGDCTENYNQGTVVTLTARADPGSAFAGWSGDGDCSDGSVTMDAAKNCTATFNILLTDILTMTTRIFTN